MANQADWRAVEVEKTPARAVGRLLRDQREQLGLSLSDVGQRLRIRRPYIEAIEEGRFDALPGAAYIPAFLRAYSVHLGLDPEKVLSAYQSSGAVPIERPTGLPVDFPLVERRAPIGLAVLTVLLVVAAGYGVWHFMPRETTVIAHKVPPVPDRLLAERAPAQPAPATPAHETRSVATPQQPPQADTWPLPKSDSVAPSQAAIAPIAPAPVPAVPFAPAATVGQAQAAQPPIAAESRVEAAPRVEAPPREEPLRAEPPRVEPPSAEPARTEPARTEPARVQVAPPARVDGPRGAPPAAAEQQEARTAPPREEVSRPVMRDTPVGVRVDSWVELRSGNGDVLTQTFVRAGETYIVPAGIAFRVISAR